LVNEFKIGDLVKYRFHTFGGNIFRVGLLISLTSSLGKGVWDVLGLNGEEHKIHCDYLKIVKRGDKNEI